MDPNNAWASGTETPSVMPSAETAEQLQKENMDHFIEGSAAQTIAAVFSAIAIVLSFYEMFQHLKHYAMPLLQRQIIRIILIVPIYALGSLMSLVFPLYSLYFNTVRDIYEAYVIHSFLNLILDFPGGEPAVVAGILDRPQLKHPIPFCCLPAMRLDHTFIQTCKKGTFQFIFIKPLIAVISLVLMMWGEYESMQWQYTMLVVYNLSYTTALYALLMYYMGTKHLLKGFHAVAKFAAVKIIVFATYYQSLVIVALPNMDSLGSSESWNDFIICVEMAVFAVMHMYCFSHKEFMPGGVGLQRLTKGAEEPVNIRTDTSLGATLARASDVLSIRDVMADATRLFSARYASYIMQGVEGAGVSESQADHIMRQGNAPVAVAGTSLPRRGGPLQPGGLASQAAGGFVVSVVHELEVGTDREALSASSPDAIVKIRDAGTGREELVRNAAAAALGAGSGGKRARPHVAGNSQTAFAPRSGSDGGGADGGGADGGSAADPYGLIVSVEGVDDATLLHVPESNADEDEAAAVAAASWAQQRTVAARKAGTAAVAAAKSSAAAAAAAESAIGHRSRAGTGASLDGPELLPVPHHGFATASPRIIGGASSSEPASALDLGAAAVAPAAPMSAAARIAASAAAAAAAVQAAAKERRHAAAAAEGSTAHAIRHSASSSGSGGSRRGQRPGPSSLSSSSSAQAHGSGGTRTLPLRPALFAAVDAEAAVAAAEVQEETEAARGMIGRDEAAAADGGDASGLNDSAISVTPPSVAAAVSPAAAGRSSSSSAAAAASWADPGFGFEFGEFDGGASGSTSLGAAGGGGADEAAVSHSVVAASLMPAAACVPVVALSDRQRRALERSHALKLSADKVRPAAAAGPGLHPRHDASSAAASTVSADPGSWTFIPDLASAAEDDEEEAASAAAVASTAAAAAHTAAEAPPQLGGVDDFAAEVDFSTAMVAAAPAASVAPASAAAAPSAAPAAAVAAAEVSWDAPAVDFGRSQSAVTSGARLLRAPPQAAPLHAAAAAPGDGNDAAAPSAAAARRAAHLAAVHSATSAPAEALTLASAPQGFDVDFEAAPRSAAGDDAAAGTVAALADLNAFGGSGDGAAADWAVADTTGTSVITDAGSGIDSGGHDVSGGFSVPAAPGLKPIAPSPLFVEQPARHEGADEAATEASPARHEGIDEEATEASRSLAPGNDWQVEEEAPSADAGAVAADPFDAPFVVAPSALAVAEFDPAATTDPFAASAQAGKADSHGIW